MAEPSNPDTAIPEPPVENPRDFSFILRPPSLLKKVVEAISHTDFNPQQEAMIQIGEYGLEITVRVIDPDTKKETIAYLRLKATELDEFQCNNPLQKKISLKFINLVLKDSNQFQYESASVFSVLGSNKLSLQFGNRYRDFGFGCPFETELHDINPNDKLHKKFPTVVNYGFEAVLPTKMLSATLTRVLQMQRPARPKEALANFYEATVQMKINNETVLNTEIDREMHEVWLKWTYWESLEKASCLSDKCSIYLVTDPPQHVMIRFELDEIGDLVYLIQAEFLSDNTRNDLSFLGLFRALKVRRFFSK